MKQLFRTFLTLSLLLLSGYSQMYADSRQEDSSFVSYTNIDANEVNFFNNIIDNPVLTVKKVPSPQEYKSNIFYAEETEDENRGSNIFKKYSEAGHYFTGFYTQQQGCVGGHFPKWLHKDEHFQYLTTDRQILYCVFRV